jgi:SAM-dependent methyltransferase
MTQKLHAMLPSESHDERARLGFISGLREFTMGRLYPRLRPHYDTVLVPAARAAGSEAPKSSDEVRALMDESPFYKGFSLLARGTQELLWDSVGEIVERQLPSLIDRAQKLTADSPAPQLQPELPLPDYTAAVDIHVMPGGYHTDLVPDDVFAGALYDRGVYVFAFGGLGPLNDELGVATAGAVQRQFPGWKPQRILDLGCGSGLATLPLERAFPDAEVVGLDLGAPMVRYAAARARALGSKASFIQADATSTGLPAASFDLIVSSLLLHELPRAAILQVLAECHRLLRPGGVMAHHDLLRWPDDPFDSFMMGWTTRHNNEPYERASGTLNFVKECVAVGFAAEEVFVVAEPGVYLEEVYQVSGIRGARKT